ncbi:MAG: fumarate hydrolyase [Lentisphaerales bacterium]|jgi:fumarate hydratase class I|nr:MAG: fumarate hydrolyase [Lentisphaerales bacterium]
MTVQLRSPFTSARVQELNLGDTVALSGRVFTARDRAHRYLYEGGEAPAGLRHGAIYHCGPAILRRDRMWISRAAGPTTSMRQDPYMARLIRKHRIHIIIGKGGMGRETREACAELGCVYLSAVGGAAQVLNEAVSRIVDVHNLRMFGPSEAIWELEVVDFPAVVTIDAQGRSLHARILAQSRKALGRILKKSALTG